MAACMHMHTVSQEPMQIIKYGDGTNISLLDSYVCLFCLFDLILYGPLAIFQL